MNAPSLGKLGADVRDTDRIHDEADQRRDCPLACIPEHNTVLRLDSGRAAATMCGLCGQAITRAQSLALLERCPA